MTTEEITSYVIDSRLHSNIAPYIYMAPDNNMYFIVSAIGQIDEVPDLKDTLDWWIGAPWHVQFDSGPILELFGNA